MLNQEKTNTKFILRKLYFINSSAKLLHTLEGHAMQIRSLTFSPDSQRLLTGSDDGQMKIYDV